MIYEKIVLIAPDTTRTGASILLLRLLDLLNREGYQTKILIRSDNGPLAPDFEEGSERVSVYRHRTENLLGWMRRKLFRASGKGFEGIFDGADVIINNTITNGILLHSLRSRYKTPIASYIHELETMAKVYTDKASVDHTIKYTDLFLVPSRAVLEFLVYEWNISREKIVVLDYYLPKKENQKLVRSNTAFTVGGCGTTDWRKGADLFLQVAIATARANPGLECRFVWKGANNQTNFVKHAAYECRTAGFPELIKFEESDSQMEGFYPQLDLFLLTSREDPYPLVVLEAAMAGVPAICFENAGGSPEFVRNNSGTVVPFLDTHAMTVAVGRYISDRNLLFKHGEAARQQVIEKHSDTRHLMQQFRTAINILTDK
jgi:glycosyltransferase involved in cell wall biosynthesis